MTPDKTQNGEVDQFYKEQMEHIPVPDQEPLQTDSTETSVHDPVEGQYYSEPGHWANIPAHRLPRLLDDGRVLLESDMRGVPTEGVQGSYTVADPEEECPTCGLPGVHTSVQTMAGQAWGSCPHCGWSEER